MRNVVASEFVTLDGVMESPEKWSLKFWNEEIAKFKFNELFSSDALLLGRMTYQGFAKAWPKMTDKEGYADRMNSLPKYVVTTTLDKGEWNNSHLIKKNVIEEISKLKRQPGQDILIFGSGDLVQTLMQHDLIDEYRLLIYPIVLGSGKRFFKETVNKTVTLVEVRAFSSGAVLLRHQRMSSSPATSQPPRPR